MTIQNFSANFMKFYNGGCWREESLNNGFYLIQIKKSCCAGILHSKLYGQPPTYGRHLPTESGQNLFNSNKSLPESRISDVRCSNISIPLNSRSSLTSLFDSNNFSNCPEWLDISWTSVKRRLEALTCWLSGFYLN